MRESLAACAAPSDDAYRRQLREPPWGGARAVRPWRRARAPIGAGAATAGRSERSEARTGKRQNWGGAGGLIKRRGAVRRRHRDGAADPSRCRGVCQLPFLAGLFFLVLLRVVWWFRRGYCRSWRFFHVHKSKRVFDAVRWRRGGLSIDHLLPFGASASRVAAQLTVGPALFLPAGSLVCRSVVFCWNGLEGKWQLVKLSGWTLRQGIRARVERSHRTSLRGDDDVDSGGFRGHL